LEKVDGGNMSHRESVLVVCLAIVAVLIGAFVAGPVSPGGFAGATGAASIGSVSGTAPLAGPPPLKITSLSVAPQTAYVGSSVSFSVQVNGGTTPYSYNWNTLPPGCSPQPQASWQCSPSGTGQFNVTVQVFDVHGNQTQASRTLSVVNNGNGTGGNNKGGNGGNSSGNGLNLSGLGGMLQLVFIGALVAFGLLVALTIGVLVIAATLARRLPKTSKAALVCPSCQSAAAVGSKFCPACGAAMNPPK